MTDRLRKRAAVLCGQPEEYIQELFLKGFTGEMMMHDMDVSVFAMYQKFQGTREREKGESAIFDLVNFSEFDAVCVIGDSIQSSDTIRKINRRIKKDFTGPVLYADKSVKDFPSVLQDNYSPIRKIIKHLIQRHGYKDIAFITGKQWHPHSKIRLKAFKDEMKESGLSVPDSRIFYGDFWYTSGETIAEKMLSSGERLPEAVACANDCMAIGFAKVMESRGIRVPQDIAVVGFDCSEEGKHSPVPITSAHLPQEEFGKYTASALISMMSGKDIPVYRPNTEMFIGRSCGCCGDDMVPEYKIREIWDTDISNDNIYSAFSEMDEELMSQTGEEGLYNTVFNYLKQAGDLDDLSMCLNDMWWKGTSSFSGEMIEAVTLSSGVISGPGSRFPLSRMLPDIDKIYDGPRLTYFLPLHFADTCFGYTAHTYIGRYAPVTQEFRLWAKKIMAGMEMTKVRMELRDCSAAIESGVFRDTLTGLYNYSGFVNQADDILTELLRGGGHVDAYAVDVKNMSSINENYGRNTGDTVIIRIANAFSDVFSKTDTRVYYLGSAEFVILRLTDSVKEDEQVFAGVKESLKAFAKDRGDMPEIEFYKGHDGGDPQTADQLERIVNIAISRKNGYKFSSRRRGSMEEMTAEDRDTLDRVIYILDRNDIDYHFQPIVNTRTGEIYAYEALMRPVSDPYIAPPILLKFAEMAGRLYDVEKLTFTNVFRKLERPGYDPGSRKIFINSIPGIMLSAEDLEGFAGYLDDWGKNIVIELTEQTELSDEMLEKNKELFRRFDLKCAVDDYGTGYSNITNILRYMPDFVKIDRSLIAGIENSPQKQYFVKDITTFSHDNGIMTLAEGVETSEELAKIIEIGVDLVQGFYTARPGESMVESISDPIREEIIMAGARGSRKEYVPGREGRILLSKLIEEKITEINVKNNEMTFIDFSIAGAPGLESDIPLNITGNYKGRISLEMCALGNVKGPGISIEKGCDVTISLSGRNAINGGIYIAEGAFLTLEGDGSLVIDQTDAPEGLSGNKLSSIIKGTGTFTDKFRGDVYCG